MGDRCFITVRVPHNQPKPIDQIRVLLEDEFGVASDGTEDGASYERWQWEEVNGGGHDIFYDLAKKHPTLQLEVASGAGSCYGPSILLLTGDHLLPTVEVDVLHDDYRPAVPVNEKTGIDQDALEAAKTYWHFYRKIFPLTAEDF